MVKIALRAVLLLGILALCAACSQNSATPETNQADVVDSQAGINKRRVLIPSPLPIIPLLTSEYLITVAETELTRNGSETIRGLVDMNAGGVLSDTPESYPSTGDDTYECSVTIEPGSVQGASKPFVEIVIEVPAFEGTFGKPHPACFDIYADQVEDLYLDPPATVKICEFHWADGVGAPPDFECVYRLEKDPITQVWNYSELQGIISDPWTGSLTFTISCIPGYQTGTHQIVDRPDRGGTWTNEGGGGTGY